MKDIKYWEYFVKITFASLFGKYKTLVRKLTIKQIAKQCLIRHEQQPTHCDEHIVSYVINDIFENKAMDLFIES